MLSKKADKIIRKFMDEMAPFNRLVGMRVALLDEGEASMEIPFKPELIGDPFRPALHGGVISALLDTCGGTAVLTTLKHIEDRASTVDLRVDYLRPGREETLIAEAKVQRAGNRVAVTSLIAYHPDDRDKPVATGVGVYNVRRAKDLKASEQEDQDFKSKEG
jgi:uncharacterized protein (TIGR00369 family)